MKIFVKAHTRKGGVHVKRHPRVLNRAGGAAAVHVHSMLVRRSGKSVVGIVEYSDGRGNRGLVEGDPKGSVMQTLFSRGSAQGKRIHFTGGAQFSDIISSHPKPQSFNHTMGAGLSGYGRRVADDLMAEHHWPAWMARCAVHEFPQAIARFEKTGHSSKAAATEIVHAVRRERGHVGAAAQNHCGATPCAACG